MFEIAEQVLRWRTAGVPVTLARVVTTRGFSSRDQAAAAAGAVGEPPAGELLSGAGRHEVAELLARPTLRPRIEQLAIADAEAVRAGLACGGVARLLVQPATDLPVAAWTALAERTPVCVTTPIGSDDVGGTDWYSIESIGAADPPVAEFFRRGVTAATVLTGESGDLFVTALWPVTTLVIVGTGLLADALGAAGALVGWTVRTARTEPEAVEQCAGLHRSDALIVLSHDLALSGRALERGLAGPAGYVGALGSRRTQAARAEWLTAHGMDIATLDRIHGPAGLDIGANTPAEIAVAIVGEVIAARTGAAGGSLRDRPGPVHRPIDSA
jgi:xanthine dehydrogenase accessory factor